MKKRIVLSTMFLLGSIGTGVAAFNSPQSSGADTSPLVQQVQSNADELANHEARITNTENNVADLQSKTSTPPSTTQVAVPATPTQSPVSPAAQTPAPAPSDPIFPHTITAYQQIPLDDQGNIDCQYTYVDGTTHQWHWQTINPQGSWQTNGQYGQWVQTTNRDGICDASAIGSVQAN
jgi:hypothetical protein